jgi:hypothetical protein
MVYKIIESRSEEGYDVGVMNDGRKIYIFHHSIFGAEKMREISEGLAIFGEVLRDSELKKTIDNMINHLNEKH